MTDVLLAEEIYSDSGTQALPDHLRPESMVHQIGKAKMCSITEIDVETLSRAVTPPQEVYLHTIFTESGGGETHPNRENLHQLIEALQNWHVFRQAQPGTSIRLSVQQTATTRMDVRNVLRGRQRDERLRRMSPERRSLYDEVLRLRKDIGPVRIDLSQVLREVREE